MEIEKFFETLVNANVEYDAKDNVKIAIEIAKQCNIKKSITIRKYSMAIGAIFNYLILPKDVLFKLDKSVYGDYISTINYLVKYVSQVKHLHGNMENAIKEYDIANGFYDNLSKQDLINIIKSLKK